MLKGCQGCSLGNGFRETVFAGDAISLACDDILGQVEKLWGHAFSSFFLRLPINRCWCLWADFSLPPPTYSYYSNTSSPLLWQWTFYAWNQYDHHQPGHCHISTSGKLTTKCLANTHFIWGKGGKLLAGIDFYCKYWRIKSMPWKIISQALN